ncbi:MAG: hypothetical protein ABFE07_06455 [Armatimonadia bacterium]
MSATTREWSFFFPGEGQDAEDATPIIGRVYDAEDAAQMAVEYDYHSCDGWERGENEFDVVVISPDGEQTKFIGCHELVTRHTARRS